MERVPWERNTLVVEDSVIGFLRPPCGLEVPDDPDMVLGACRGLLLWLGGILLGRVYLKWRVLTVALEHPGVQESLFEGEVLYVGPWGEP